MSAASFQYQVTDEGDVVVILDGVPAGGTMGWGEYDGFSRGKPVDAHIEKTSDNGTEYEGKDVQQMSRYNSHSSCSPTRENGNSIDIQLQIQVYTYTKDSS